MFYLVVVVVVVTTVAAVVFFLMMVNGGGSYCSPYDGGHLVAAVNVTVVTVMAAVATGDGVGSSDIDAGDDAGNDASDELCEG
jgi:hypothetical protein